MIRKFFNMTQENSSTTADRELTFGEKAVGFTFNPSNIKEVDDIKRMQADYIDYLANLRNVATSQEVKRMLSVAITEAQSSQMWAVKAVTWRY